MFLLKSPYHNPIQVTIDLLQQLRLRVTNTSIKQLLEKHPAYPSLLAIHDAVTHFNISAAAIDADRNRIQEFPLPFMAYLTTKGGQFVTVVNVSQASVTYKANSRLITSTLAEFTTQWNGKTLLVQANAKSGQENYAVERRKEVWQHAKIPLFLAALFIALFGQYVNYGMASGWQAATHYLFTGLLYFMGVLVSSLLLWYEVDTTNTTLQQICTAGAKTNCNAILHSKQSKFLGWLTWSEIGFYYFLGGFFTLLLVGLPAMPLLALFNFLAIPYIFFSVYYQWQVVKQWCVLCLAVQAILLVQGIINIFFTELVVRQNIGTLAIPVLVSYLLPIVIWNITKPYLLELKKLTPKVKELGRLKANTNIFESLLVKQKQIAKTTKGLGVVLAKPHAKYTIIKVCNPYCGPCAKAHPLLESILHSNKNVQVQVIFTATTQEADKRSKPVKHFLALQQQYGVALAEEAMAYWYNMPQKNYEQFAAKYPVSELVLANQAPAITAMKNWCDDIDIQFTPTFFINGYQLPEIYTMEEVKYLLED